MSAYGRHPSAQVVAVHGELLLIDCGEATQMQMQRYGIKWGKMHHIFISHMHGDHYFGLPGLLNSMSLMGRKEPLHLYAPAAMQEILNQILTVADTVLSYPLHFHELPEGAEVLVDSEAYTVTCFPVNHRIRCHGFLIEHKQRGRKLLPEQCELHNIPVAFYERIKYGMDYTDADGTVIRNEWLTEDGPPAKRYAYCADTLFTDSYLPYIQGADTIYHESTYLEADKDKAEARFHSTAAQAAQIAKLAGVKQLLLGHFSSKYKELAPFADEASAIFQNVMVTEEGVAYEI